ncbi:MAG: glycosyltransferase family 2 protein [Phycisphaerae bacterium]
MKSVFLVPVYNQARELPAFLEEVAATRPPCDAFLFVNDGSTDGSREIIRASGFEHLDFAERRGIGHCMMRAVEWALANDFDILGGIAGNGKMRPGEMHRLLDPILNDEADFTKGSRYLPGGSSPNLPMFRRMAIPLVNRFVHLTLSVRLTDATCGYRAYRLELIRRARFNWRAEWLHTYGFEYYLDAKFLLDGRIRWREVPVTMHYPGGRAPYSKIRPIRDWYAMLKPWIVARFDGRGFAPAHAAPPAAASSITGVANADA